MGQLNATPVEPQYTKQDLNDAYSALLNDLNDAYWAASDVNAKDEIYGLIEAINTILTEMDAVDLESRDAAYTALLQKVTTVNKGLQVLQKQIDSIIKKISTAAAIVSDVTKVLTVAAKVLPAV